VPRKLKAGTIQRIKGSESALQLSLFGLAVPRLDSADWTYCAEVGLLGASAELAVAAVVHEVAGEGALLKPDGRYVYASECLEAMEGLLAQDVSELDQLVKGVSSKPEHIAQLAAASAGFRFLLRLRAAALHAGEGVSRAVAMQAASDVYTFLSLLGQSTRWNPYVRSCPPPPEIAVRRELLVEELVSAATAKNVRQAGQAVLSLFLVVPELSREEPEWLAALDRVTAVPTRKDITLLMKSLQAADIGSLIRSSGSGAIPVTVQKGAGLKVDVTAVKRSLENPVERWNAAVGLANGGLNSGQLYLPPVEAIYELFESRCVEDSAFPKEMTAHEAWPFIAAALSGQGTEGPVFFIAKALKKGEDGQLLAQLKRAAAMKGQRLARELSAYEPLLVAAARGRSVRGAPELLGELDGLVQQRRELAVRAKTEVSAALGKKPSDGFVRLVADAVAADQAPEDRIVRLAVDAAFEQKDVPSLCELLAWHERTGKVSILKTNIRKALRGIDFGAFGPS